MRHLKDSRLTLKDEEVNGRAPLGLGKAPTVCYMSLYKLLFINNGFRKGMTRQDRQVQTAPACAVLERMANVILY